MLQARSCLAVCSWKDEISSKAFNHEDSGCPGIESQLEPKHYTVGIVPCVVGPKIV